MKRIDILKYRKISFIASSAFILLGVIAFVVFGGFNTGIDFGAGFSERVQVAPAGLSVSYSGSDNVVLGVSGNTLELIVRNSSGVSTYSYPASKYPTVSDLAIAFGENGLEVNVLDGSLKTDLLVSGFGFPATLSEKNTVINFATSSQDVTIENVREALGDVKGVKVQTLGTAYEGIFQIRINVGDEDTQESLENTVNSALYASFGKDNIVVMQSDFVGPKFSAELLKASLIAVMIAMAFILVYVTIRFRVSYAISSLAALLHDVLSMLALILILRLEISSTTIAAILTIIGYSLNNTIVIFDRVRENIMKNKDGNVAEIVNDSVNQSLTRTLITSLTTLFAIVPLAIFSSGDIKLFAINLTWGILVGAYSSNFIAPSLLLVLHKKFPINVFKEADDRDPLLED